MISLPKMRQYDVEYETNEKVKRFDKIMPNCLICWDTIHQSTHICCKICDIRLHKECYKKYREFAITITTCPHCRQPRTLSVCNSKITDKRIKYIKQ
jgi:hypothetical protein